MNLAVSHNGDFSPKMADFWVRSPFVYLISAVTMIISSISAYGLQFGKPMSLTPFKGDIVMNYMLLPYRKFGLFSGRSSRKEFWLFYLFVFTTYATLYLLIDRPYGFASEGYMFWGMLSGVFAIASLFPAYAVVYRRLHDSGRSGWWLLAVVIPDVDYLITTAIFGINYSIDDGMHIARIFIVALLSIIILVLMLAPSEAGKNRYGENPAAETTPNRKKK